MAVRSFVPRLVRWAWVATLVAMGASSLSGDEPPPYFSTPIDFPIQYVGSGADGTVYAAGHTEQPNLPGTADPPPDDDRTHFYFVSAMTPDGRPRWVAYIQHLGSIDGWSRLCGMSVARDGSVWLAGTASATVRVNAVDGAHGVGGGIDAWVARFSPEGKLVLATKVGGSNLDMANGIATTSSGDAILAGITMSHDFPTVQALQPTFGGGEADGFVARIRADGSGFAYASYLGGQSYEEVTALAVDANDEAVVASRTRLNGEYFFDYATRPLPLTALEVTRIGIDGTRKFTAAIPHSDVGGAFALASAPDGSIVLGGTTRTGSETGPFVLRLSADGATVEGMWSERSSLRVVCLAVAPSGRVLVTTSNFYTDLIDQAVTDLTSDLRHATRLEAFGGAVRALAFAPDGALLLAGDGYGVPFNPLDRTYTYCSRFVARVPGEGAAPPAHVRVRRSTTDSVDLTWTDAVGAVAYEIERFDDQSSDCWSGYHQLSVVATLPSDVRELHVAGLSPGSRYVLRVVSLHESGVRLATPKIAAYTQPVAVASVGATLNDDSTISVTWHDATNGNATEYRVERRIGDDRFRSFGGSRITWESRYRFTDIVAASPGVPICYRVRATLKGRFSPWIESRPVRLPQSLVVEQVQGSVRTHRWRASADLLGTFASPHGVAPVRFDPTGHDLTVMAGDAALPFYCRIPSGDSAWLATSDGFRWRGNTGHGLGDYTRVDLRIDPRRGTIRLSYSLEAVNYFRPLRTSMSLHVGYAGFFGGEVREWQTGPGDQPSLDLR